MSFLKSKSPSAKKLSGIVLAAEIGAIVLLHAVKLTHQEKNEEQKKVDVVNTHSFKINPSYSFTSLR